MSSSKDKRLITRRRFLGEAPCAAVGSTALFSSLLSLKLTSAAAANTPNINSDDNYKALVCIFLAGGNDSFNMLVPRQNEAYNTYANTRDNLAVPKDDSDPQFNILPIATEGQAYSEFGVHPKLNRFQTLYNEQKLAFVANVGTLIQPITKADYQARRYLPKGLFSHSDQQAHWQTCLPQVRGGKPGGWGGRASELLASLNAESQISMNISVSGLNIFQTSDEAFSFVANNDGGADMIAYSDPLERAAVDSLLTENYKNLFQKNFGRNSKRFIESSIAFNDAFDNTFVEQGFPNTAFGNNLKTVARTIAAHNKLKMKRQTFFVRLGGWDHHTTLLDSQNNMYPDLSESLYAFQKALEEIGEQENVLTFSVSDFGRTLTSNDAGSDHGWGGNAFVIGGPVQGGRIYGTYPDLHIGSDLDTGRGRQIPTTSVDQYCGEIAKWFGVSNGDLETVFPNIQNFYDPYSLAPPLGFVKSAI
ncbi:DUF1501 domain-containing protein [Pelagicoccus sp. NFK12]|uniref:DUF1501 domain-containing protein n=1 Tax=Pelagicoccus enzymogenes TaxID=2773457 RepID=A0A927FCB4_9BACT|nr:DUF1501 domain-containing protein [Pelagicoccus enzymogenes]MBD5781161.1 DUF1501 domain-containing protein [Pelagicoccus enzymogenes]